MFPSHSLAMASILRLIKMSLGSALNDGELSVPLQRNLIKLLLMTFKENIIWNVSRFIGWSKFLQNTMWNFYRVIASNRASSEANATILLSLGNGLEAIIKIA
jgi:hypothetical protein